MGPSRSPDQAKQARSAAHLSPSGRERPVIGAAEAVDQTFPDVVDEMIAENNGRVVIRYVWNICFFV